MMYIICEKVRSADKAVDSEADGEDHFAKSPPPPLRTQAEAHRSRSLPVAIDPEGLNLFL